MSVTRSAERGILMSSMNTQSIVTWLRQKASRLKEMADEIETTLGTAGSGVEKAPQANDPPLGRHAQLVRELRLVLNGGSMRVGRLAKLVEHPEGEVARALASPCFGYKRGWWSVKHQTAAAISNGKEESP